jgi:hypothetical protein
MNTRIAVLFVMLHSSFGVAAPASKPQQLTSPNQVPEGLAKSDWSSIRAAYDAGRHAFQPIEGGWQARNPGQQWTTKFDGRGFIAQPRDGGWQWGLELKSYGFGEKQTAISGTPAVKAAGQRLSYQWDATVQEWWVNDQRGLEHGFTVAQRPSLPISESLPLAFTLTTRGTLKPDITPDAQGVLFQNAAGATVLNYTGLKVWDADGKTLPSRFEAAGENKVRLLVNERGARYPITIDPIAQQAYLKPAAVGTMQTGDQFGYSVAVAGDTVVVGARLEDSSTTGVNSTPDEGAIDSGAAYVFVRSAGVWTQQAYLKPGAVGTTQAGDWFGSSVAISGDTLVVGALREDSITTGVNSSPDDIGGNNLNSGAAYVFVRSAGVWTEQAYLKPTAVGTTQAGDQFGYSVAISGDAVVVGARFEDSSATGVNSTPDESAADSGAAYVFVRSAGVWTQQAYLKPAAVGTTQAGDWFGYSVALSGDTVVVGAYVEDSATTGVNSTPNESGDGSGAAYIFVRNAGVWAQQAYLKPAAIGTTQAGDRFGCSVAVSDDTVVVGAQLEDSSTTGVNSTSDESATDSGAAYVFVRNTGVWTQQAYLKPAAVGTTQAGDRFGWSVALSGGTVVVGAFWEDSSTTGVNSTADESAAASGAAYVFVRSAGVWTQQAYLKPAAVGTTQADDNFGWSVALSGDTVVVGAYLEDSSTTGMNSTPNENGASFDSGAAYTFTGLGIPEIVVEQPAGTSLTSNVSNVGYGGAAPGRSSAAKTFTLLNTGPVALTISSVAVTGGNAGDFTLNTAGMLTSVPASTGSTTFTVTFTPAAVGSRTTTLRILNDDSDESTFDITLTGTGLSFTNDTDGDGLNDASEFNMAALGFDWQVNQSPLVATYYANANGANLYTPAQVQALNMGVPLIQKSPAGIFTLTIGVEKSTTLQPGSFQPFPMTAPQTTINGSGKLEFQFTVPDNAAFFRLQAQ